MPIHKELFNNCITFQLVDVLKCTTGLFPVSAITNNTAVTGSVQISSSTCTYIFRINFEKWDCKELHSFKGHLYFLLHE